MSMLGICLKRTINVNHDIRKKIMHYVIADNENYKYWKNMLIPYWHFGANWNRAAVVNPFDNFAFLDWAKSPSFTDAQQKSATYLACGYRVYEEQSLLKVVCSLGLFIFLSFFFFVIFLRNGTRSVSNRITSIKNV